MTNAECDTLHASDRLRRAWERMRRAFREFLALPTSMISAFLVLAVVVYAADRARPTWLAPARRSLEHHAFVDASTTTGLLTAIAAGIITVTSITVSVLLLAVQQSAASMSTAVFDQFLRRRENQLSFGFFIGLALYTLITLATVHEEANAVFGATLAFVFTVVALYVLLVLLYSTIDQMRPSVVLGSIGRLTLEARRTQAELIARTRRLATPGLPAIGRIHARTSGYVTHLDLTTVERAFARESAQCEVMLLVSIGSFVAYGDVVAVLHGTRDRSSPEAHAQSLEDAIRGAVHLEADRDIGGDPAYGIEQIHNIGWTSISSAKSNPAPGLFAIRTLRDLLARWADAADTPDTPPPARDGPSEPSARRERRVLPVIYTDDTPARVFGALESLGVSAGESKQHQSLAEVLRAISTLLERLTAAQRRQAAGVIERLLPSLSSHVLTAQLREALLGAADSLDAAGEHRVAAAIRTTWARHEAGGGHCTG